MSTSLLSLIWRLHLRFRRNDWLAASGSQRGRHRLIDSWINRLIYMVASHLQYSAFRFCQFVQHWLPWRLGNIAMLLFHGNVERWLVEKSQSSFCWSPEVEPRRGTGSARLGKVALLGQQRVLCHTPSTGTIIGHKTNVKQRCLGRRSRSKGLVTKHLGGIGMNGQSSVCMVHPTAICQRGLRADPENWLSIELSKFTHPGLVRSSFCSERFSALHVLLLSFFFKRTSIKQSQVVSPGLTSKYIDLDYATVLYELLPTHNTVVAMTTILTENYQSTLD